MTPSERLFNETYFRTLRSWSTIASFRRTVQYGMEAAARVTAVDANILYNALFDDPLYAKLLADREAFRTAMPLRKFTELTVQISVNSAMNSLDAATLIFAHAMVDGAAFDYCRVTALHAPADWEFDLLNKQVSLAAMRNDNYEHILHIKLEETLASLEMQSLRDKINRLHARCQPPPGWSPMDGYDFDLQRIERLDRLRHEIVHGEALDKPIANMDEELSYLIQTCVYFLSLVNHKYGLQIDPSFFEATVRGITPP